MPETIQTLVGKDPLKLMYCCRQAALKERGLSEHQQTQPGGPREEDSAEAEECREEQSDKTRAEVEEAEVGELTCLFHCY